MSRSVRGGVDCAARPLRRGEDVAASPFLKVLKIWSGETMVS